MFSPILIIEIVAICLFGINDFQIGQGILYMKKKIIFIIPNLYALGGMERVTIMIANELAKMTDCEVSMLSLCCSDGKAKYEISSSINIINLRLDHFAIRKDFLKVAKELKKIFPPDFKGTFIVDDVGHAIPVYLGLKRCKRANFICWSHMNYFNGRSFGFAGIGKRLVVKKFNHLIVLTKEDQGYYKQYMKSDNVIQIYNPRDKSLYKRNYAVDSRKIISCGRLEKVKGFDKLLEVARIVFAKTEGWRWDIYGDGPEKEYLESQIQEYHLQDKVYLMGYRDNIYSTYGDYAFNVFTSRAEGCPMAMIEALSAGLPIVSFDFFCGPKDLITDGINGFIVKKDDLSAMAEKIIMLMQNREMRAAFSQQSGCNLKELDMDYVLSKWKEIV